MAIVTLFNSCGVMITESQWREVPFQEGEIRVLSCHGERLEFNADYTGIGERKLVMGKALAAAGLALDMGI